MLFFIRSIFAQTLLNAYLVSRIWKNNQTPRFFKWILSIIYAVETGMYFVGLFGSERLPIETIELIQKISGVWVIGNLYFFMLILLFDLINYLNKRWLFFDKIRLQTIQKAKVISFIALLIFIGAELYFGYENFLHPKVKTYPFSFNKPENESSTPKATYKLLVASDIHLGYIIDKEVLKKYVDFINAQQADIVVIDGDLIDYTLRPLIAERMDEELRTIKAPKGVFFIPGNHEYKFNPELKLDWIAKTGLIILKDSIANIDNMLWLIGRDDNSNEEDRMPIEELMTKVNTSKPCLFLAHQPADIIESYKYKIPLTICGHTHGGQAFPMNFAGDIFFYNLNPYGLRHKESSYSYTTSGLGLSGFPLRIGPDSEIVIFNIKIY